MPLHAAGEVRRRGNGRSRLRAPASPSALRGAPSQRRAAEQGRSTPLDFRVRRDTKGEEAHSRMNWRHIMAARILGGTLTITPRALEHLTRLEEEDPRIHQRVMEYVYAWSLCHVEAELYAMMFMCEHMWHRPTWKRPCNDLQEFPEWFVRAYHRD